jgi:hypothetical protein
MNIFKLGKKVLSGNLSKNDLLIDSKILINAGIQYYKKYDDEYLNCLESNKGWFEICTISHIAEYIRQIKK